MIDLTRSSMIYVHQDSFLFQKKLEFVIGSKRQDCRIPKLSKEGNSL